MITTAIAAKIRRLSSLLLLMSVPGWAWGAELLVQGQFGDRGGSPAIAQETTPIYPPDAPPGRQAPLPDRRQDLEEQTVGADYRVSALQAKGAEQLWVGSWQGLAKINPKTGQILDRVSLPNQTVGAIAEDKSGRIWVGTYSGIVRLDPKTGTVTAQNFALPSNRVLSMLVDHRGFLWVGTDAGLAMISPDQGLLMTTLKVLPGVSANALALDALGNLWVGTLDGVVEVDTARARVKRRITNLPGVQVQALAVSWWGTLWIGPPIAVLEADIGIKRVVRMVPIPQPPTKITAKSKPKPTRQPAKPGSKPQTAQKTVAKPKLRREVVYQQADATAFKLRSLTQLQGRNVTALEFDRANSLWVGTTTGLLRVNPFNGAAGGTIPNLPSDRVLTLAPDAGGKVWVGTSEGLAWVSLQSFKAQTHQTFRSVESAADQRTPFLP